MMVLVHAALATGVISGAARIVDGDTIAIDGVKIRLEGIDAPESDQVCLDQQSTKWTCGIAARDRLAERIGNRSIDCTPAGSDKDYRTLAVCRLAGEDLNAWMVRQGWALAFVRYSKVYVAEEEEARSAKRGLWSGAFIAPWDWRHRNCKTQVLGAISVPINAEAILCSASDAPTPECDIKGHVNRKGERIYFLPGQLDIADWIWPSRREIGAGSVPRMMRLPRGIAERYGSPTSCRPLTCPRARTAYQRPSYGVAGCDTTDILRGRPRRIDCAGGLCPRAHQ